MGKRRTKSQRIGTTGEDHFRLFAGRHYLIANKCEQDFGTDFICQVEGSSRRVGSAPVLGGLVGAFVRSTESKRGRIRLSQADAEHLLACDYPVFLIHVHLKKDDVPVLHYKFVNGDFGEKLANHIISGNKHLYITPSNLNHESNFEDDLTIALSPGFVEQCRVQLAAKKLNRVIPNTKIQISRSKNGSFTLVKMRDFFRQFKEDLGSKNNLYNAVFGHEKLMVPRFQKIPIQQELLNSLEQLPSPIVIGANLPVKKSLISVISNTGITKICEFEVRRSPGYVGWVHQTGFALTATEATRHEGQWVHKLRAKVDPETPIDLSNHNDLWSFLEYCEPGAKIQIGENDNAIGIDIFEGLSRYGFFAKYLSQVVNLYSWQKGTWLLEDAEDDELLNSLAFLYHTEIAPQHMSNFGFSQSYIERVEFSTRAWVPICINNRLNGLIVWFYTNGKVLKSEQRHVGFRFGEILEYELEVRGKPFDKGIWPELVVHPDINTVPIIPPEEDLTDHKSDPSDWSCAIVFDEDS